MSSRIDAAELDRPHVPLGKFRVLYIGRAAPKATLDSIESLQKPLCELYTKDDGQSQNTDIDAVLVVYTSGLLVEPVNPLDDDRWLPIQNLQSCAAVKAVVEDLDGCSGQLSFVPIDSKQAATSKYPPIFSCIMGRSNGLPITDCYAFICQSNDTALLTVQATMHAFSNRSGWASDRPPKRILTASGTCNREEIVISQADDTPSEFYERPPLQGFFYTPSPNLIQKFHIKGEACSSNTQIYNQDRSPYISQLPAFSVKPPPPPAPTDVNPMVFYDTEQDAMFVDRDLDPWDQIPSIPGGAINGPSQSIAFNPYLVPAMDPHPSGSRQTQSQSVDPYGSKLTSTAIPDELIVVPVVQGKTGRVPGFSGDQGDPYQKHFPQSNIGIDRTYSNQGRSNEGRATVRDTTSAYKPPFNTQNAPYVVEQPTEVYSRRLPPPAQDPLPQGTRQFDSNFILQQSDTDKARIADVRNFQGYPVPPNPVNIAEFGY